MTKAAVSNAPVIIIGAGAAGLMAADVISRAGVAVELYDAMPSPARKLLRAGVGGLNLTHSEAPELFATRYAGDSQRIAKWLHQFGPQAVRAWALGLGIETFIGSSGRVFPVGMKAASLLRAWLARLDEQGVRLHRRHRWTGWDATGCLCFSTPTGERKVGAGGTATLLALGGGSWSRLGTDGSWMPILAAQGIALSPLRPANCGFSVAWSPNLREKHAGTPLKNIALEFQFAAAAAIERWNGECIVTRDGIEGGVIYAASRHLRDTIEREGTATVLLDLLPQRSLAEVRAALSRPRGRDSLSNHLRRQLHLTGIKAALIYECTDAAARTDTNVLAAAIKAVPLQLRSPAPIDGAISTAGGVRFEALTEDLMLSARPGVFCAGEMLDWEAPTGGYLLTACFASGVIAGEGILARLGMTPA